MAEESSSSSSSVGLELLRMRLRSFGAVEAGVDGRESSSSDSSTLERRPGRDAIVSDQKLEGGLGDQLRVRGV